MIHTVNITVTRSTLADGSHVFSVIVGDVSFDATDQNSAYQFAYRLAENIELYTLQRPEVVDLC